MQPNPNLASKQAHGLTAIEELKAAGEELKRAEQRQQESKPQTGQELKKTEKGPSPEQEAQKKESDPTSQQGSVGSTAKDPGSAEAVSGGARTSRTPPSSFPVPSVIKGETKGWVSLEDYQSSIVSEKQRLREAHKKIGDLEQKVRERMETLKKMEGQTEKISKALKELGQRIVLVKKEDDTLLYQIKETLGE